MTFAALLVTQKRDKTKVSLQSMDIKGDKLVLAGTMFVPKNAQETRK